MSPDKSVHQEAGGSNVRMDETIIYPNAGEEGDGERGGVERIPEHLQETGPIVDTERVFMTLEEMRNRMKDSGLLDHEEVRAQAEIVNAAMEGHDEISGEAYAALVLAPVIRHRSAINHVLEHLKSDDNDVRNESLVANDMIRLLKVGQGGMGRISVVHSPEHDIHILKESTKFRGEKGIDSKFFERFDREAAIMEKLDGSGVPRFIETGDIADDQGRSFPAYGYEWQPRRSLQQLNKASGGSTGTRQHVGSSRNESRNGASEQFSYSSHLEGETVMMASQYPRSFSGRIVAEVAKRFTPYHEAGVVHRDLKPGNIMITDDGVVEIIDFGLGDHEDAREVTQTADVFGTPTHMAPEQFQSGKNTSPKTDVWSLGVIYYEMLTGMPPFSGKNAGELSVAIQTSQPDMSLIKHEEDRMMITQMLEKNPKARPSMREVAEFAFNNSPDLKKKFGKDFSRFMENDATTHAIEMPQVETRAKVRDLIGEVIMNKPDIDLSSLEGLRDGPLDQGIEDSDLLHSIRTQYSMLDAQMDESFLQRKQPPFYRKKSVLAAGTVAGIGATVLAAWHAARRTHEDIPVEKADNNAVPTLVTSDDGADGSEPLIAVKPSKPTVEELRAKMTPVKLEGGYEKDVAEDTFEHAGIIKWGDYLVGMEIPLPIPGAPGGRVKRFATNSDHNDVTIIDSVTGAQCFHLDWEEIANGDQASLDHVINGYLSYYGNHLESTQMPTTSQWCFTFRAVPEGKDEASEYVFITIPGGTYIFVKDGESELIKGRDAFMARVAKEGVQDQARLIRFETAYGKPIKENVTEKRPLGRNILFGKRGETKTTSATATLQEFFSAVSDQQSLAAAE